MTFYNKEYEDNPNNFDALEYKELLKETFGAGGGAYLVRFSDEKTQWIPKKCACLYKMGRRIEVKTNFCIKNDLHHYKTQE